MALLFKESIKTDKSQGCWVLTHLSHEKLLGMAYLAYFGVLGVFVPYIGLYLDDRGLNSHDIGLLLAIVTGMRIIGPSLWAQFATRKGDPVWVMRFGAVLATIGWCSSFFDGGYALLLIGLSIYSLCWTAILPQLETSAFYYLENDTARYSKVRSAGSVGYILLVVLSGYLLERFGPGFLPACALLFLLLMLLTLWQLPKFSLGSAGVEGSLKFRRLWRHQSFVFFMLAAFLLQVSFAPFYSFFTIYTRDLGYSGTQSGLLIGLAVAAEIIAFYFAGKILKDRSYRNLLSMCYGLTAIRWTLVAFYADNPVVLALSMLLHAFSFALAHSCAMQFIQQFFPSSQRSRGQALYAGLVYGGGGAFGAYLCGWTWQDGAGSTLSFLLAASAALIAACLTASLPKHIQRFGQA